MPEWTIRAAKDAIRWPREAACRASRRVDSDTPWECICRQYGGAGGFYVIAPDGHARGYAAYRGDAVRIMERYMGAEAPGKG